MQHFGNVNGQVPHTILLPQESTAVPHSCKRQGDLDLQPHTLGVPPPPQVLGATHCDIPQSTLAPQMSVTVPHLPAQVDVTLA